MKKHEFKDGWAIEVEQRKDGRVHITVASKLGVSYRAAKGFATVLGAEGAVSRLPMTLPIFGRRAGGEWEELVSYKGQLLRKDTRVPWRNLSGIARPRKVATIYAYENGKRVPQPVKAKKKPKKSRRSR